MDARPEHIADAITDLRAGRLVAFPTETVYGLGADAWNADAVAAVFAAKGRPATNPLIVHVSSIEMARTVCTVWPAHAQKLALHFWPGPLTLLLPRAKSLPAIITAGSPSVAIRCPDHPLTLALIEAFGLPLVGPSANRSGKISPTCAADVRASFDKSLVTLLDGGPCCGGIESTVLDITHEPLRVLRPGPILPSEISSLLGVPVEMDAVEPAPTTNAADCPDKVASPAPMPSPGMLSKHYAPTCPAFVLSKSVLAKALPNAPKPLVVMASRQTLETIADEVEVHQIEMPTTPSAYGAALYASLRRADALHAKAIYIITPWPDEANLTAVNNPWSAAADRLFRAASQLPV